MHYSGRRILLDCGLWLSAVKPKRGVAGRSNTALFGRDIYPGLAARNDSRGAADVVHGGSLLG